MAYNTRKMLEDSNGDLIPQYFNQSDDRYEHLRGEQGVQFTGNHVLTESGIWVPQRGTEDGAAHTQLTGSNVEEIIPYNAEALTSTSSIIRTVDISRYRRIMIFALNTHDVDVDLSFRAITNTRLTDVYDKDSSSFITNNRVILPTTSSASRILHINSAIEWLNDLVIGDGSFFGIRVQALDTPTEGAITVYVMGVV